MLSHADNNQVRAVRYIPGDGTFCGRAHLVDLVDQLMRVEGSGNNFAVLKRDPVTVPALDRLRKTLRLNLAWLCHTTTVALTPSDTPGLMPHDAP
jgi:hypothetical protein